MIKENFIGLIEKSIKSNWNIVAFSDFRGKGYTYSEVAKEIARLHKIFQACDVQKTDKIALIGKNSCNWCIAYLATLTYGAVIVPVLPDFLSDDVHHIVNHSESKLIFSSDSIYDNLEWAEMPDIKAVFSLTDFSVLHAKEDEDISKKVADAHKSFDENYPDKAVLPEDIKYGPISNDQLAIINYTSGTTGFSKGVMLNFNAMAANIIYAQENMPLKPGDKIVSFLPLAHTYGCSFEFIFPFTLGCHITFLSKIPSPNIVIEAFKEVKPRLILSVPLVIEKIYKKQIAPVLEQQPLKFLLKLPFVSCLVYKKIKKKIDAAFGGNFQEVVIGGAAFNPEVENFFRKIHFRFSLGYGMTECAPLISYASWQRIKPASAGKLIDFLQMKIDSPDPKNVVGEILLKGENIMLGYYKNEKATQSVFDSEGWFHTGDLGLTDDEQFIYIKGRSKYMILGPSGQNIYPEEIEAKLDNLMLVQDSIVIEEENKIVALISPDFDMMEKHHIKFESLEPLMEKYRILINRRLPAYSQISKMRLYDKEFEKTPKSSIKRYLYTR